VKDDLTCGLEEQEFKECVENLLDHLIVFLLGAQQILQHLD
jgi:hypothetical protein